MYFNNKIFIGGEDQELIKKSVEAREYAYCPYSQFSVGAAVRTSSGCIYTGCNVENSAYSACICAERTAIVKAVSEGNRKLIALAVSGKIEQNNGFVFPCGLCLQFISEFAKEKDIIIYLTKPDLKKVFVTSIKQLLPHDFTLTEPIM